MTARAAALLSAVALAVLAGCSATDDRPDSERIVGTRVGTTVNTRVLGVSVPVLDLANREPESTVTFTSGGGFDLDLSLPDSLAVGPSGNQVMVDLPASVSIAGTYTLDTAARTVTVTRTDRPGTLTLGYAFRGTDGLELIANDDGTFAALVGVAAGPQYEALASVITGGSIRFDP